MSRKRKFLLVSFIVAVLLFSAIVGTLLFYYYHPSKTKSLLEDSISGLTGAVCTMEELSYSVRPLTVKAKGILIVGHIQGFQIAVPELTAGMALEGPLGNKTLTLTSLLINGFSFTTHQEISLDAMETLGAETSFLNRSVRALVTRLLFRDIKIQALQVSEGHVFLEWNGFKLTLNRIGAGITPEHLLEITCSAKMEWPYEVTNHFHGEVRITGDQILSLAHPEMKGTLAIQGMGFDSPQTRLDGVTIESELTYDHERRSLRFHPLQMTSEGLQLKGEKGIQSMPAKATLMCDASLDLTRRTLEAQGFHLQLPDMLEIHAALDLDFSSGIRLEMKGMDGLFLPEKWLTFLPETMKRHLSPLTLSGPVRLEGGLGISLKDEGWKWACDLQVRLRDNPFSYSAPHVVAEGTLSGELQAKGEFPQLRSKLNLSGDQLSFRSDWMDFNRGRLDLSAEGETFLIRIHALALKIPEALSWTPKGFLPVENFQAELLNGTVDIEKGILLLPELEIQSSLLRNLSLSLNAAQGRAGVTIEGKDVHLLDSAYALNLIPSEWRVSGLDALKARLTLEENGKWKALGEARFEGSRFQNEDSTVAGENISLALALEAAGSLKQPLISLTASLQADKGELLLSRFYLDLSKNKASLSMNGTYDPSQKTFLFSPLELALEGLIALNGRGTCLYGPEEVVSDFSIQFPRTGLKPIFQNFLLEPFGQNHPLMSNLDLEGSVSANVELRSRGKDLVVRGRGRWEDGSVTTRDNSFSLHGISLDLPFWYQSPVFTDVASGLAMKGKGTKRNQPPGEENIRGRLAVQSFILSWFPEQALEFPLEAGPNLLSVPTPTLIKVPGGEVRWGPMVMQNVFSSSPFLLTDLQFKGVVLDSLLSKVWPRPARGFARGLLDPIEVSGNRVTTRGEIVADLFGGTITLSQIGGENIFSTNPVVHLDARTEGLLLGELTGGTAFGEVEGVLRGQVKDLEIAEWEPQSFHLLLETVHREGVPQRISVRAVDNIAQIGGGQNALSGITGTFTSFFKDFPYDKIGVSASLENDVFRINGTILEGGKEYLVKRGGFSGVNVVNQNPENVIGFKDMVKRIKRVTTSRGAVVAP